MSISKKNMILVILAMILLIVAVASIVILNGHITLFNSGHWSLGVPIRWTIPYMTCS